MTTTTCPVTIDAAHIIDAPDSVDPSRGSVTCTLWGTVIAGGQLLTELPIAKPYSGPVTVNIPVLPSGSGTLVRLEVDGGIYERLVNPPNATPVKLFDLPDLDRETMGPLPSTTPAWVSDLAAAIEPLQRKDALDDNSADLVADPASELAVAVAAKIRTAREGSTAPLASSVTPAVDIITRYDATAANRTPTLPALSTLNDKDELGLQRTDSTTGKTVTFTCAGSDTFDSGGTTLTMRFAELRTLRVVTIGGTKFWKVVGGNTPLSSLDAAYQKQVELNVLNYGFSPSNSGAVNATASDTFYNVTVKALINAGNFVKVVYPPGDYNMDLGTYALLPAGKGGLHISAYGARLIFTATPTNAWAMLRIRPDAGWTVGTPPADNSQYIDSIYIEGLGIVDNDAVNHAGAEETHGINVAYARNVRIWNCHCYGTGDEPIEVDYCEDFSIYGNYFDHCQNIPLKASADGANISIKNGCKRGKIYANDVNTSVGNGSKGVQVKIIEAAGVEDIEVWGNTFRNVMLSAMWINTSNGSATRINFHDNIVDGCITGVGRAGANPIIDSSWIHNNIRNCTGSGAELVMQGASKGNRFDGNEIVDCGGAGATTYGAQLGGTAPLSWATIHGNKMRNIQGRFFYLSGDALKVSGGFLRDGNLAAVANQPSIGSQSGVDQVLDGVTIINPGQRGVQNIHHIRNCHIEGQTGDAAVLGFKNVAGGRYLGRLGGIVTGGSVTNAEVDASAFTTGNAIDIGTATDCRVVGNKVTAAPGGVRRVWSESAGADRNLFLGNHYKGIINVVGAASVQANNIAMP